ncbi:MAG: J domain-containing protein [Synechococcaceae bacterium WB9_4xC_028]|nr:J domain-containing protein [Synechococcaceae bacterium WB9_4xC_028]
MGESGSDKRRITLELSADLLGWIDGLKSQMGFRNRGLIVEQLLRELVPDLDDDSDAVEELASEPTASAQDRAAELEQCSTPPVETANPELDLSTASAKDSAVLEAESGAIHPNGYGELDENTAIVLIGSSSVALRDAGRVSSGTAATARSSSPTPAIGIQLPGFVRRQAQAVKRSLAEQAKPPAEERPSTLALIPADALHEALERAQQHWLEIYGTPPSEAAQDAALTWLARDIWPQSDHSDGRPFSWGLAQQVLLSFAPGWVVGDPSLERVITAAGILEDPFGANSLAMRVPTLITRFVQRQRSRQKRHTSFDAIDQSMTVHGALRLLQLPTIADRPYTLKEIREAYREQAQSHHPDAGGSADAMRRLNEAYQFLKERYRQAA